MTNIQNSTEQAFDLFNLPQEEIWKDIPDYEGYYQASTLGRIRSVDRYCPYKGKTKKFYGAIRVNTINKYGYYSLGLSMNDIPKSFTTHRLIAITFLPNPENKRSVNHKNGIKTDNRAENLEWATDSENTQHAYDNGLNYAFSGEKCHLSKLNDNQVLEIRKKYVRRVYGVLKLAKEYDVTIHCISCIVNRKTWKHIP